MEEVERTDPDPPPTLVGTRASGAPRPAPVVPARGSEIGRYLVTGEIGRGAMGSVLAAYDADLDRKVAIKLIAEPLDADEDRRRRLLGEAKSMARIAHPNVVTVYDAGVWRDRLWVAMELVEGVTLDRWRAAAERSTTEIVDTFVAAGRGLAAAHDAGVLHGDFKPSNVLVASSGRVVVADFGLANPLETPRPEEPGTSGPTGTPAYMSPEHFAGVPTDARADQFAFSVALFEQLTGDRPFAGRSLLELASAISQGRVAVAAAARIPARLRAVVMRGLAALPDERFASMQQVIDALHSAVRPRWRWQLAAVAVLALGGGALGLLAQHDEHSACPPAHERVLASWNDERRASVSLQAEGMTAAALQARTDRLKAGVDAYMGEWSELYEQACTDGAATSREILQQARMACLENRFAAGVGLVELLGREVIPVRRVDGLLEALPDLADCRGPAFGRWEPVPAEPELAREVAALRARLGEARVRRRAGHVHEVGPEVAAVLAAARASGLSHVVAEALLERAAVLGGSNDADGAEAAVGEALEVALRDGHDFLAARAINRRLLLMHEDPTTRPVEAIQWARMGEALTTRAGASSRYLGDFANNLCIALRHLGELERALAECRRAEQLYGVDAGSDARPTIGARVNQAAALIELGRYEEAEPLLRDASEKYDAMLGREHGDAITVAWNRAQLEVIRGKRLEALAIGNDAMARQLAATGAVGTTARASFARLATLQVALGDLESGRASMAKARQAFAVDESRAYDAIFTDATIEAHSGDYPSAIALYTRVVDSEPAGRKLRERSQLYRGTLHYIVGHDADALADAKALCGDRAVTPSGFSALLCYATGGLAAVALGDQVAAATWLAWSETTRDQDAEDVGVRQLLRAAVGGRRDAASIAAIRATRDMFVARGHAMHPNVRVFDRWLASVAAEPR